jgi:hypothetical protein
LEALQYDDRLMAGGMRPVRSSEFWHELDTIDAMLDIIEARLRAEVRLMAADSQLEKSESSQHSGGR